jgi:hypothetical protein
MRNGCKFVICSAKLLHANGREKSCDVKRERERERDPTRYSLFQEEKQHSNPD